jgi:hypothetical protein
MPKPQKVSLNTWTLRPEVAYWRGSGDEEHSVLLRQLATGEYMVLIVKGSLQDHEHATQKFHRNVLDAMKVARKLIGADGRWTLSSSLEFATKRQAKDGRVAVVATIHSLGGEAMLSVLVTPLVPTMRKKTARKKVDQILSNHAHSFTKFKDVPAAIRATPAAMRSAVKAARCECKEIGT